MSTQDSNNVVITGGTINGIDPIPVESGGTGASTIEEARTNLDAQQHSDRLDRIASLDHNNIDNQIIMSLGGGIDQWNIITAETARVELGLKIGATAESGDVQAWDSKLQNFSDGNPIPDSLIFSGDYFITTPGVKGQFWSADGEEAGIWRSFSSHFNNIDNEGNLEDTISINTGTEEGDIVELELGWNGDLERVMLPGVDGSQLTGLNAEQINTPTDQYPGPVSTLQFLLLKDLRLDPVDGSPDSTFGPVQGQLDLKAHSGQNEDITEIIGLTTMLAVTQGGPGASNADTARLNLDAQQQNVHLDDLSDGELSATAVEHGTWFIDHGGDPGQMWAWELQDTLLPYDEETNKYGTWIDGGDITRVYTEEGMGLFVGGNGSYAQDIGDVEILVDAGTDVDQIPRLVENPDGGGGGSLPVVDGSQLYGLDATQILSTKTGDGVPATPGPVSNEQFELLSDLRTDPDADHPVEDYTHGDVQAQFDNKQQQSDVLDDIVDATEANVAEYDLLIYKSSEDDGSWELLKSDDEEYHITASRVEHGDFFISEAGIAGDIWMSDGSEAGAWWKAGMYLTIGNDTLDVNVGTAANQVIALNAEAQLPAVDASLLLGLTAEQINVVGGEPSVTNEEFNALGDLRLESTDATEAEDNWRLTYGIVQDQLDDKQNGNANLDDLADGELTYDKVEFGEFFIKQAGDDDKVWTWVGTEADGAGSWIMPPGAQRLNDLMDASTMPLAGDDESSDNVFIGEGSGNTIDGGGGNGNLNTALGRNTLASLEDGNLNVAIGKDAGQNIVDGNGNILIGFNAGKDLGINASNKLIINNNNSCLLYTSPSPRDLSTSRMPSSA